MNSILSEDEKAKLQNLEIEFNHAANHLKNIAYKLDSEHLLYFYSRYKRVTVGKNCEPKPHFYQVEAKKKWSAWNDLNTILAKDAMQQYIDKLKEIDTDYKAKTGTTKKTGTQSSECLGLSVSKLRSETDDEETDETQFGLCKDGRLDDLKIWLKDNSGRINEKDDNGLSLLHWGCDRQHYDIVKLLLDYEININEKDEFGETGLHYAILNETPDIVKLLIENGADKSIPNSDGDIPEKSIFLNNLC